MKTGALVFLVRLAWKEQPQVVCLGDCVVLPPRTACVGTLPCHATGKNQGVCQDPMYPAKYWGTVFFPFVPGVPGDLALTAFGRLGAQLLLLRSQGSRLGSWSLQTSIGRPCGAQSPLCF